MRSSAKTLLVSLAVFLLLCAAIVFFAFMYLTGQSVGGALDELHDATRLSLYRHGMVEKLSSAEIKRLYLDTCTRKCHGKDVIENKPRTAAEWEAVMVRMKAPDRADMSDRHAETITRYLQSNFLSNVPTVLPEKTMKYVKLHLWRSDFGESDLFLDLIYIPYEHRSLLPYLGVRNAPSNPQAAFFVVYVNTHQGSVPPWDFTELAALHVDNGAAQKAGAWKILYEDGQRHHNQGVLVFPDIDTGKAADLEIKMRLPGLGTRSFQWCLPIPPMLEGEPVER